MAKQLKAKQVAAKLGIHLVPAEELHVIDVGAKHGLVWQHFRCDPPVQKQLPLCGFGFETELLNHGNGEVAANAMAEVKAPREPHRRRGQAYVKPRVGVNVAPDSISTDGTSDTQFCGAELCVQRKESRAFLPPKAVERVHQIH